jgi:hypothetical protein
MNSNELIHKNDLLFLQIFALKKDLKANKTRWPVTFLESSHERSLMIAFKKLE